VTGRLLIASWVVAASAGCAARTPAPQAPAEAARHRAALASVAVINETGYPLEIAFRTAVPPIQETMIGRVAADDRAAMAPVPAGEPVVLIARRPDGAEYQARIQSFPLDGSVEWRVPKNATFLLRDARR
jgi:hypothetical protein